MSIKIAGSPVCLDHDGELQHYLDHRLPPKDLPFAESGTELMATDGGLDFRPNLPEIPECRISELIRVTGASRFSRSLQVVDFKYLPAILNAAWGVDWDGKGDLPTDTRSDNEITLAYSLGTDSGVTHNISEPMHLLTPIQLDGFDGHDLQRQLWLLPLVGWQFPIIHQALTIEVKSNTTWADLFGLLSVTSTTAVHADYLQPDPGLFSTPSVSRGQLIDLAAASIGRRAVYKAGDVLMQTVSEAVADLNSLWPGLPKTILGGQVPYGPRPSGWDLRLQTLNDLWPWIDGQDRVGESPPGADSTAKQATIVSSFFLERFNAAENTASKTRADALIDRLAADLNDWAAHQYDVTWAGCPDNAGQLTEIGFTDYQAVAVDSTGKEPVVSTHTATIAPDITPNVNLCQSAGLYVHQTELAHVTFLSGGIPAGQQFGDAEIADAHKSASPYDGTPVPIRVHRHPSDDATKAIEQGDIKTAYYQQEQGWTLPVPSDTEADPVTVVFELATVLDPITGYGTATVKKIYNNDGSVNVDDTISVGANEPLFTTARIGARGVAIRSGSDTDNDPPIAQAWQILHIWLPTDCYRVKLAADLYHNNNAEIEWESTPIVIPWSVEPYRHYHDWLGTPGSRPTVTNPYYHDAQAGAIIEIRAHWDNGQFSPVWYVDDTEEKKARVQEIDIVTETAPGSNVYTVAIQQSYSGEQAAIGQIDLNGLPAYLQPSVGFTGGPDSIHVFYDTNDNKYKWLNHVKYVARWVLGQFTIPANSVGQIEVSLGVADFFDGYNPGSAVTALFNTPLALGGCEAKTTFGWARYRPELHKWQIIGTVAGLMGSPHSVQIPVGAATADYDPDAGCDVPLCYTTKYQTIQTFGCVPQSEGDYETKPALCIDSEDLCKFICTCCDVFAYSDTGQEECKPCTGSCVYDWNISDQKWDLTSNDCETSTDCGCDGTEPTDPPDPTDEPATVTVPCKYPPPPPCDCGNAIWTWEDPLPGWNLTTQNCDAGCESSPPLGVGTETGETQITCCVPTDPPVDCCDECGGDEVRIINYSVSAPMQYDINQNGASRSAGGDGCTWTVPVQVTTYEGDEPHDIYQQYNDEVTITHHPDNRWTCEQSSLTIPHTNPPGGTYTVDVSWFGTKPCDETTVSCNDSPGLCPQGGDSAAFDYTRHACPVVVATLLLEAHPELAAAESDAGCKNCDSAIKWLRRWPIEKIEQRAVSVVKTLENNLRKAKAPAIEPEQLAAWLAEAIAECKTAQADNNEEPPE